METGKLAFGFIFVVAAVLLVVAMPLALIWAVNVLFATAIPVTLKTWAAALLLSAPFAYSGSRK